MGRRALLVAAGWLGAAVLAVAVGLGAIGVIGSGLTAGSTPALSAAEVERQLGAGSPAPAAAASIGDSPSPAPSATDPPEQGEPVAKSTRGGTVVARCTATGAEIVTMSPAQGFAVHEKDQGPQAEAEGEFRGSSDDHDRVKVTATCPAGVLQVSVRSEGGDD
jgi:hypothetical protein